MNRYNIITTVDLERQEISADGAVNVVVVSAGSVINTILWDGVSEWTPPENTKLEIAE